MATMADLDELALALPQTTKELSEDGRPSYLVHGKVFCFHRGLRRDAIDPDTGERLDDVLMFRVADLGVKELILADDRGSFSRHRISTATPPCSCAFRIWRASIGRNWKTRWSGPGSPALRSVSQRPGSTSTD
jgi:hypothetical protein